MASEIIIFKYIRLFARRGTFRKKRRAKQTDDTTNEECQNKKREKLLGRTSRAVLDISVTKRGGRGCKVNLYESPAQHSKKEGTLQ